MRNLILLSLCMLFFIHPATSQSKTVEGYTGAGYDYIGHFNGDQFTLQRKDGFAVVNLDGSLIASGLKASITGISSAMPKYHGILFAEEAGNTILKDLKGRTLGTGKYKEIVPFVTDNTVARVPSEQGAWIVAYLDTAGKEIVRFDVKKYLSIVQPLNKMAAFTFITLSDFLPFSEGLTPIKSTVAGKYGFIDKKLNLVIPVSFKEACPFSDGLAAVQNEDGNWGFINTKGKLVIPYTYSRRPSRFMSGRARVQNKDGRMGYINKENQVVIAPQYEFGTCFYKGYALVRESYNHPPLLIDSTGAIQATFPKNVIYIDNAYPGGSLISGSTPEYPFYVSETLQQLVDEGKGIFKSGFSYGLLDNKGRVVLDFKYDQLTDYHGGKMFAHKSSFVNNSTQHQYGIINDHGELVLQVVASEF